MGVWRRRWAKRLQRGSIRTHRCCGSHSPQLGNFHRIIEMVMRRRRRRRIKLMELEMISFIFLNPWLLEFYDLSFNLVGSDAKFNHFISRRPTIPISSSRWFSSGSKNDKFIGNLLNCWVLNFISINIGVINRNWMFPCDECQRDLSTSNNYSIVRQEFELHQPPNIISIISHNSINPQYNILLSIAFSSFMLSSNLTANV